MIINKILVGIIAVIGFYIIYITIKGALQLKTEFDELELSHTYNLLVIYKKHLTGKEDIKLSYEVTRDIDYLFNPFNFKTLLMRETKNYIIQYFKDNYYILNETIEKWPGQTFDIERMRKVIDKWI